MVPMPQEGAAHRPERYTLAGDLFYLTVEVQKGDIIQVTAGTHGFYINKSSAHHFSAAEAPKPCASFTLVQCEMLRREDFVRLIRVPPCPFREQTGLLSQYDPKFTARYKVLKAAAKKDLQPLIAGPTPFPVYPWAVKASNGRERSPGVDANLFQTHYQPGMPHLPSIARSSQWEHHPMDSLELPGQVSLAAMNIFFFGESVMIGQRFRHATGTKNTNWFGRSRNRRSVSVLCASTSSCVCTRNLLRHVRTTNKGCVIIEQFFH